MRAARTRLFRLLTLSRFSAFVELLFTAPVGAWPGSRLWLSHHPLMSSSNAAVRLNSYRRVMPRSGALIILLSQVLIFQRAPPSSFLIIFSLKVLSSSASPHYFTLPHCVLFAPFHATPETSMTTFSDLSCHPLEEGCFGQPHPRPQLQTPLGEARRVTEPLILLPP